MTHTTTEIAAMIERLEHMSKNTRDEYLHELAGRLAGRTAARRVEGKGFVPLLER